MTPSQIHESLPSDIVAVLIPCYNEEITIGKVVDDLLVHHLTHQFLEGFNNAHD